MLHVSHPKISIHITRPLPRAVPRTDPRARADTERRESWAAPLVLAAIVVGDLLLAGTVAVVSALGA